MKKIFLLGALVASTMAFASMESNSVLDTLKSGSVTVKGVLDFDANSRPSISYKIDKQPTVQGDKEFYSNNFKKVYTNNIPSFGGGLEVEYSVPVYNINDDMSILVAAGLNGSVKYGSYKDGEVQKYKYDETEKMVKVDGEAQDGSTKYVMTSISALMGPRFSYKLNDDIKLIAGVDLGIGGEIHSVVSTAKSETLMNEYKTTKDAEGVDATAKTKVGTTITDGYITSLKTNADNETYTTSTVAFPMSAVLGVDYKNIVVTANLGGKVLAPKYTEKDSKHTDQLSFNLLDEVKYDSTKSTVAEKFSMEKPKATPKFIFSAGLKVGYRFDLDKFMK